MIARTSRVFLEVVAATLLGLVLLVAVAAWRLSQGPVTLTFLTPTIEEALNAQGAPFRIEITDTNLAWAGWERTLDFRAVGARALAGDGRVVASVPEISISLSARALFRGMVAPTRLELIGPRVRLVRTAAGGFELAFGDTGAVSQAEATSLVEGLLAPPDRTRPLGYLRRISIVDAELTVDDRMSGTVWGSPRADVAVHRVGDSLQAALDLDLDIGGARLARLSGNLAYRTGEDRVRVETRFDHVRTDLLAARLPAFRRLRLLRLAFGGRSSLEFDLTGRLTTADFDLSGRDGRLAGSPYWPDGLAFESLSVRGRVQRAPDFAVLDRIALDLGGPVITGQAVVTRAGETASVNGQVVMRAMTSARLANDWPRGLATSVRNWIVKHIFDAVVDETRMEISLRTDLGGKRGVEIDSLTGSLRFTGATVHYLKPLPPARDVAASARFDRDSITIDLKGGELEGLRAESGRLDFTRLDTDSEQAAVDLVVRGPLSSALKLIDHPEFGFAREVGVDAAATTGDMAARLVFSFPLHVGLTVDQVSIAAAANLRNVSMPDFIEGQALSRGALTLRVDKSALDVSGTALLGSVPVDLKWFESFDAAAKTRRRYEVKGTLDDAQRAALGLELSPYVRGPVAVELALLEDARGKGEAAIKLGLDRAALKIAPLGWSKPPGKAGIAWLTLRLRPGRKPDSLDFSLRTTDLRSAGSVVLPAAGRRLSATLRRFAVGATDVSGTLAGRADGGYDVRLRGPGFDAAPLLRFDDDDAPEFALPPIALSLRFGRLWYGTGAPVGDVAGTLRYDGSRWRDIALEGRLDGDRRVALRLLTGARGRRLSFTASDAGVALRTFGIIENIRGGRLRLTAERDFAPAAPWRGRLLATDFRLVDAPLLTKILALASLTGTVDALRGKGIQFLRLEIPYVLKDRVIVIDRARSVGGALGLTASGRIDLARDRLKLRGTIVPAYTINSLLGNIPVLGKLFTGSEGGGVFAATYRVEGPLKEPIVTVNPLAALAPGFLRDLVSGLAGGGRAPPPSPTVPAPTED